MIDAAVLTAVHGDGTYHANDENMKPSDENHLPSRRDQGKQREAESLEPAKEKAGCHETGKVMRLDETTLSKEFENWSGKMLTPAMPQSAQPQKKTIMGMMIWVNGMKCQQNHQRAVLEAYLDGEFDEDVCTDWLGCHLGVISDRAY